MEERLYQKEVVDSCVDYILRSKEKGGAVGVAPTGSGKSYIIALIVQELYKTLPEDGVILVVQPTKELLVQNLEKIEEFGFKPSVYSASLKRKEIGKLTYATASSLKDAKVFEGRVKVLIQDECHLRSGAGTEFKKIVKRFKIDRFIGLTASPVYLSNEFGVTKIKMMIDDPSAMYKKIVCCVQISEMIKLGYWAKLRYQIETIDLDMLKPNTSGTDFTEASLENFYEENDLYSIVNEILSENPLKRSVLVFASNIKLADKLADSIPGAVSVHGKTESKIREKRIKDFKDLKVRVVVTVLALATGFDHRQMDMLIDCSPTGSFQLHYQKWGRIVRIHPEKEEGLIVDLAGNFDRFGKLEDIRFIEVEGYGWVACSKNKVLTDVAMNYNENKHINDLIGKKKPQNGSNYVRKPDEKLLNMSKKAIALPMKKYRGKKVHEVADSYKGVMYLTWAYFNATFESDYNEYQDKNMKYLKTVIGEFLRFNNVII